MSCYEACERDQYKTLYWSLSQSTEWYILIVIEGEFHKGFNKTLKRIIREKSVKLNREADRGSTRTCTYMYIHFNNVSKGNAYQ